LQEQESEEVEEENGGHAAEGATEAAGRGTKRKPQPKAQTSKSKGRGRRATSPAAGEQSPTGRHMDRPPGKQEWPRLEITKLRGPFASDVAIYKVMKAHALAEKLGLTLRRRYVCYVNQPQLYESTWRPQNPRMRSLGQALWDNNRDLFPQRTVVENGDTFCGNAELFGDWYAHVIAELDPQIIVWCDFLSKAGDKANVATKMVEDFNFFFDYFPRLLPSEVSRQCRELRDGETIYTPMRDEGDVLSLRDATSGKTLSSTKVPFPTLERMREIEAQRKAQREKERTDKTGRHAVAQDEGGEGDVEEVGGKSGKRDQRGEVKSCSRPSQEKSQSEVCVSEV